MAGSMGSDTARLPQSSAWFEAFGARGLASLGAVLGLILSVTLVLATAPPLPAGPSQSKSRPVVRAEKSASEVAKPGVTSTQASLASPQPLVSAPKAQAPVAASPLPNAAPPTTPRPLLSTPSAECSDSQTPSSSPTYSGASESSSSYSGSGSGTVQVGGYYRKNGTYVQPHTRRSPRR